MEDKLDGVIKMYDFKVLSKSRLRGALLLETDKGCKLVKQTKSSAGRLVWEHRVKTHLKNNGFCNVDAYCINVEGNISTPDIYGVRYTVSDWFKGRECDLHSKDEVSLAAKNLGKLHIALDNIECDDIVLPEQPDIIKSFEKHNNELKHIRNYLRKQKEKNEFEIKLMRAFSKYYDEAVDAVSRLQNLTIDEKKHIIHGSYTYHNIIMCEDESDVIATTIFDKCTCGARVMDIYYFIRKVMEKNDWDYEYGENVINSYSSVCKIDSDERVILKHLLMYPEKFWKLASYYMNSKKTWISQKNIEKLDALEEQYSKRLCFISEI